MLPKYEFHEGRYQDCWLIEYKKVRNKRRGVPRLIYPSWLLKNVKAVSLFCLVEIVYNRVKIT